MCVGLTLLRRPLLGMGGLVVDGCLDSFWASGRLPGSLGEAVSWMLCAGCRLLGPFFNTIRVF